MAAIRPQPGPQESFLSTPADIAVFGGGAFGGKTFALLIEVLRHIAVPGFGAVIFRRTTKQIRMEGGLWDESQGLYRPFSAVPRDQMLDWRFPSNARATFAGMEHEQDRFNWDGAQIPLIGFDQLEHFTRTQFFYMLSRNRSGCGVRPYIRATCNPQPDIWLREFLDWWIDDESGYAIEDRSGVIRWFIRIGDDVIWADTAEALVAEHGAEHQPLSVTFIRSKPSDNPIGLAKDPGYMAKLRAMDRVERERLERGNWKIRPAAGLYFQRDYFEVVDAVPAGGTSVRYWDLAATEAQPNTDPDWTAGVKVTKAPNGYFYVEHVNRMRGSPMKVERTVKNTASQDGKAVRVGVSQDPGQAGKAQAQAYVRLLAGYNVRTKVETGDKVTRAGPVSAQAEAGNVKVLRGAWNDDFLTELENFPEGHDDQVDALSGAFRSLSSAAEPQIRAL